MVSLALFSGVLLFLKWINRKVSCSKDHKVFLVANRKTYLKQNHFLSIQFSSVTQSCPTLWDPKNRSTPGLPVHHHLLDFMQTHVHRVNDAIQPSHPLSSPSPPAPQSLPASESFPVSQLFALGGQSIGVSASASVIPMNIQDWVPLAWTGLSVLNTHLLKDIWQNTSQISLNFL